MFTRFLWLLPIFFGIYIITTNNYLLESIENYLTKCIDDFFNAINDNNNDEEQIIINNNNNDEERIWTRLELEKYTNLENGLYLAILGKVFDVTKGVKHYGPGETYHSFTGNFSNKKIKK